MTLYSKLVLPENILVEFSQTKKAILFLATFLSFRWGLKAKIIASTIKKVLFIFSRNLELG